jgi:RNA polymerase sigma-70 factor (ECF subfamily)
MALEILLGRIPTDTEDRLALRAGAGDAPAFDEIVTRYQLRLFRFAFRLLRDRAEAEDAVQEAFIRTYRALPSYRPDGYFSSWIYRITLNECRRRMRGRKSTVSLDMAPVAGCQPDPQQAVMTHERHRQLRAALAALPEHYRMTMLLFYFEEMSVEQIARALCVSVSAVKVRLHRGRDRLAVRLSHSFCN